MMRGSVLGAFASNRRRGSLPSGNDPYWNARASLLNFDTPAAVEKTSSGVSWTYSASNTYSSSIKKFSAYSLEVSSGANGGLRSSIDDASCNALSFGYNDFTLEAWVIATAKVGPFGTIFGSGHTSWGTGCIALNFRNSDNTFVLGLYDKTGSSPAIATGATWNLDQWYHTALVRQGDVCKLYVDGSVVGQVTGISNINFNFARTAGAERYGLWLGANGWGGSSENLDGNISEFRVSNYAVYTANFTPPTDLYPVGPAPTQQDAYYDNVVLLLRGAGSDGSTSVVDDSKYHRTATVSNVQILGNEMVSSGDAGVLQYDSSTDFALPMAYTLEFDFTPLIADSDTRYGMSTNSSRYLSIEGSSNLVQSGWGGTGLGIPATLNTKMRYALCRDIQGNMYAFKNGTLIVSSSSTFVDNSSVPFGVFNVPGRSDLKSLNARISNFRLTQGVSRYIWNYTPLATSFPTS